MTLKYFASTAGRMEVPLETRDKPQELLCVSNQCSVGRTVEA